jgi:uncharacterized protein (DUF1330 family)
MAPIWREDWVKIAASCNFPAGMDNGRVVETRATGDIKAGLVFLHSAQTKPPAYGIVAIRKINDADAFKLGAVDKANPAASTAAGGRFARRKSPQFMERRQALRFIAFDSVEKAKAWSESAAQKEISAARSKSADSCSFIVQGM